MACACPMETKAVDFMSGEPSAHGMCFSHGATRARSAPDMSAQACLCSELLQLESAQFCSSCFFVPRAESRDRALAAALARPQARPTGPP